MLSICKYISDITRVDDITVVSLCILTYIFDGIHRYICLNKKTVSDINSPNIECYFWAHKRITYKLSAIMQATHTKFLKTIVSYEQNCITIKQSNCELPYLLVVLWTRLRHIHLDCKSVIKDDRRHSKSQYERNYNKRSQPLTQKWYWSGLFFVKLSS